MKLALRAVLSALVGVGVYSLLRRIPLNWLSLLPQWLFITISVMTSIVTFLGVVFDWVKKPLETMKLWQETAKLRREAERDKKTEEEKKRSVRLATPEEIRKYGASYVERAIDRRYRQEKDSDYLTSKPFITDSHEK